MNFQEANTRFNVVGFYFYLSCTVRGCVYVCNSVVVFIKKFSQRNILGNVFASIQYSIHWLLLSFRRIYEGNIIYKKCLYCYIIYSVVGMLPSNSNFGNCLHGALRLRPWWTHTLFMWYNFFLIKFKLHTIVEPMCNQGNNQTITGSEILLLDPTQMTTRGQKKKKVILL